MSEPSDIGSLQEQIRLLTHVVSQLVTLVTRMNLESYMDTTPLHQTANMREQDFRDVNEALENLRATLAARLSQLEAWPSPASEPDIANPP